MIRFYFILALGALLLYAYVVRRYIRYWGRIEHQDNLEQDRQEQVDVLIAFRNEANHLETLVGDLKKQSYPSDKFKVYFINDHSTDQGPDILQALVDDRFHLIGLDESQTGKKAALMAGLRASTSPYVLMTDADTRLPEQWVEVMSASMSRSGNSMISGPVMAMKGESGHQEYYENELAAFTVVTGGAIEGKLHGMANGANMMVRRSELPESDPFQAKISPSGDDIFLAEYFFSKDALGFVKSTRACVLTFPPERYSAFERQKIRWASKNQNLKGSTTKFSLLAMITLPIVILLGPLLALMYGLSILWLPGVLIMLKAAIDYQLISTGRKFANENVSFSEVFRQQFLNLRITLAVIRHSFFGNKMHWKGREY